MVFLCVRIDLQLSASFLTALTCRLRVLPAACAIVRGRILEAHSFGRNNDVQRDVHILMSF